MTLDATRTVSLGSQYLAIFNEIEAHVRHSLDAEPGVPFMALVGKYRARYNLPTSHYNALKALTALRNAISHGEFYGGRPIAEPVDEVVREISVLRDYILRPPLA